MVNKCVVYGCKSGYSTDKSAIALSTFRFPLSKPDLLGKWVQFVHRSDWSVSKNSVICVKHFENKYLIHGHKRTKLDWKLNPIPSIHSEEALKRPSTLCNPPALRKAPKVRVYQADELSIFNEKDHITSLDDFTERHSPPGYTFHHQKILYCIKK